MFELLLQPHTMENGIRLIAERARKDAGICEVKLRVLMAEVCSRRSAPVVN